MTTESRIKAVLAATPEQLAAVDAVLAGNAAASPVRVIRRRAVAAMLGVSPRTVDALRRAGHLRAVRLPGRNNVLGYVEADVEAIIKQEGPCKTS